ncbi:MAG TPA: HEAT repeat domain-containing protein [Candidatus Korarchaeota archaeon]|nr:HEAT repeat domain-containing protein [Candidatus Korarchaeota archaeon]
MIKVINEEDLRLMAFTLQLALGLKSEKLPSEGELQEEIITFSRISKEQRLKDLISNLSEDSIKKYLAIALIAAQADFKTLSSMASGTREERIIAACASFLKKDASTLSLFRTIIQGSDENLFSAVLLLLISAVQHFSNDELIKELEKWLEWPDVQVRISAVKILSNLGSRSAPSSEKILNILLRAFDRDPNRRVRESIATQLGILAAENPSLKNRSYSSLISMFRKERSAKVRKAILDSLLTLT